MDKNGFCPEGVVWWTIVTYVMSALVGQNTGVQGFLEERTG